MTLSDVSKSLAEKPAFKDLLGKRRCLVLADGFYEWRKEGKGKVPMRFKLKSGEPFTFAGLWDSWKQPDGSLLRTYTIVTTEPNDVLRPIHNRMPVMLTNDDARRWLAVDQISQALSSNAVEILSAWHKFELKALRKSLPNRLRLAAPYLSTLRLRWNPFSLTKNRSLPLVLALNRLANR